VNKDYLVALFIPTLGGGGAERVVVNLAKGFLRKGFKVNILLVDKKGPFVKDLPEECQVINFHSKRTLFTFFKIINYINKEKPYVFISHLTHANIVSALAQAVSREKTKLLLVEHNTLSEVLKNSESVVKRFILRFLIRFSYRFADSIIAVSTGVANDFAKFFPLFKNKIQVIYNPFDLEQIQFKSKEDASFLWKHFSSKSLIISVGRLTKQKDFPTLIKAFAIVRKEIDARLVILGEGEERKNLENLAKELGIEEFIWMPGFVDNPYNYMSKASVFVLSSIYEGLPTVLIEALALGCQVVSTDCKSGPREILDNGKYGKLVKVGDVEELAKAILETIKNPINPNILVERAKMFSVENIAKRYLEVIGWS